MSRPAEDSVAVCDVPDVRERPPLAVLLVVAVVTAIVLAAQVPLALDLLKPAPAFEARHAVTVLLANAAAAASTALAAALLPRRWRALALLPGLGAALTMTAAALTFGGHLWGYATALLTLAAAWVSGRWLLTALWVRALRGVAVVELTIGMGILGVVVLLLGRLGLVEWWSAGLLTLSVGAVGTVVAARTAWTRRSAFAGALLDSPLATACAGLLLLQAAWATVWMSAPEIMYDALYAKAFLPQSWAESGSIGPLLDHPVLNVTGLAQYVAVPGHVLGAPEVGRMLQFAMWASLVSTVWWWGRRSAAGPLAALAVGIVPALTWQAATAYDDLFLAVGGCALAIAVMRTADAPGGRSEHAPDSSQLRLAFAIGLLAGACVWLKLNLLIVAFVLTAGWIVFARPRGSLLQRAAGVAAGGLLIAGPVFALRWIDTGNPVFPSYNTLFKSPHYPLVNEQFNFPFWKGVGLRDALRAPYEAIVEPTLMNDSMPPGALGLLVAAIVLAVVLGWRHRGRHGLLIAWLAVLAGLAAWWIQFRYLRYVLPIALVAVLLLMTLLRGWRPGRVGTAALLACTALASAAYLPSTVASFWNVPGHRVPFAAAFGRWAEEDYLRGIFPEYDALAAYERMAPPGAIAISEAHQRTFVSERELSPIWEISALMRADGPLPTDGDETLEQLQELGIGWAVLGDADRASDMAWVVAVLEKHGEIVFADRGWTVWRLVDAPVRPRPGDVCDAALRGLPACWAGTLDDVPGLFDGESAGGVTRQLTVCRGQTIVVELTTAEGGQPAQVMIDSDGTRFAGHHSGLVAPGTTGRVPMTVPQDGTATVRIVPGASGGAIERARAGVTGRCD